MFRLRHTIRLRRTLRLRLTLLYGALFLVAGAALLAITYGLASTSVGGGQISVTGQVGPGGNGVFIASSGSGPVPFDPVTGTIVGQPTAQDLKAYLTSQAEAVRAAALRQLLIVSGIALVIMAGLSIALGWLVAGRALRPLRAMTGKARQISEANLHERLALVGPDDELKDLGDTFDGLLGRLDAAFGAQKRFVANASHELRTPLTLQRAMLEVALADPAADTESLRAVCRRVLAAGEEQERLIEALLTLARSQRGLDERVPVDLADVVKDVVADDRVTVTTEDAATFGDPRLVARLVANLVDNAVRHNVPDGSVEVRTGTIADRPTLRVTNDGPVIPADLVTSLFQPFRRLSERTGHREGLGLGLSIVAAIAEAHHATVAAAANPDGGLTVMVTFPIAPVCAVPRC